MDITVGGDLDILDTTATGGGKSLFPELLGHLYKDRVLQDQQHTVALSVEALRCKPEGPWLDSLWVVGLIFSATIGHLTEMNTRCISWG